MGTKGRVFDGDNYFNFIVRLTFIFSLSCVCSEERCTSLFVLSLLILHRCSAIEYMSGFVFFLISLRLFQFPLSVNLFRPLAI